MSKSLQKMRFLCSLSLLLAWLGVGSVWGQTSTVDTWDGTKKDIEWEGDGSQDNPYQITSAAELAGLAQQVNAKVSYEGKYFKLTTNIDLNGSDTKQWTPIGKDEAPFSGHFDGNNKTISGLFIKIESGELEGFDQGLFGYVVGTSELETELTTIKNLTVEGSVQSHHSQVGGLVGRAQYLKIENCDNKVNVSGNDHIGGLVGYGGTVTIKKSTNTGAVTGESGNVGGLVGEGLTVTITESTNTGAVTGESGNVGGLVGYGGTVTITESTNERTVTGKGDNVGGLVGQGVIVGIENSTNEGTVSGTTNVGGLVGYGLNEEFTFTNCYNAGAVSGTVQVGGLVGKSDEGEFTFTNCYNTGAVTGNGTNVGGLVGYHFSLNTTVFTNCYNTGAVTGNGTNVGGLVGAHAGGELTIESYYNAGAVSGTAQVGGLVGNNGNTRLDFNDSHYLVGTAGKAIGNVDSETVGRSLSAEALATSMNENGFSSTPWAAGASYDNGVLTMPKLGTFDAIKLYPVTITPATNGSITSPKNNTYYAAGEKVILVGTANSGYELTGWTVSVVNVIPADGDTPAYFIMPANGVTITATFGEIPKTPSVELPTNLVYDGTAKEVIVKLDDEVATSGFSVAYNDNVNVGTVTATVTFDPLVPEEQREQTVTYKITPAEIVVTPESDQVRYWGDNGFEFVYNVTSAQNGEVPGFRGELDTDGDKLVQGSLQLENNGSFLAKNYTMTFVDGVTYTEDNKNIYWVLSWKAQEVNVTNAPDVNKYGWTNDYWARYTIDVPKGFEVSEAGTGLWCSEAFDYFEETNGLKLNIRQCGGTIEEELFLTDVKIDYTAPKIEVKRYSDKIVCYVTDNCSGVNDETADWGNNYRSTVSGLSATRAASGAHAFEIEDRANEYRIVFNVKDYADNVASVNVAKSSLYMWYQITLPTLEQATLTPEEGACEVREGKAFSFKLTPSSEKYTQENFVVKVGEEVLTPLGDVYTIDAVNSDLTVTVNFISPTAIEEVIPTEFGVRTEADAIVISAPKATPVYITDFSGRVLRSFHAPAGTTRSTGFAKGMYIVHTQLGTVKIAL